ncbi:DUF2254 domain-containing protein [Fodinisporobacter ferrooxydans]|uniref:DUF2254 domain-containing protein n=1 Tax=Fodinisporobacter ferrooxydans TaxID=2901836 RepID=A0ABY4CFX6_9BACL|nr:DUF2254 domain-containing protein [Alicyclobacillaceae bacterium MYW30-H2]
MHKRHMGLSTIRKFWHKIPFSLSLLHLMGSWAIVEACILFSPQLFTGTSDTALNFLNTIVSCVATILALCISIIMVAIQMTASKYSHRVLDLFIRCPYNISLLVIYFGTIFHCIFLMARIQPGDEGLSASLNQAMSGELLLVICCFFSLFLYSYGVIQLLKPETIIRSIDREYHLCFLQGHDQEALMKVVQISDIAKKAVIDMDAVTGVMSTQRLGAMLRMAPIPKESDEMLINYHQEILQQLLGIAHIAFKERENTISQELLEILLELGTNYAKAGSLKAAGMVVELYSRIISNNLIGQHQFNYIETIVRHIYTIAYEVVASDKDYRDIDEFVLQTFQMLNHVGKQVLDIEVSGASYVARDLLSDTFGELITSIVQHAGPTVPHRVIRELMFEYMKLARLLLAKSEMRDIVQITTWLRNELLPIQEQNTRVQPYLYLFLLLIAVSLYLQRKDIAVVLIRSLGKYFKPEQGLLEQMRLGRMDIRYLFDYANPDPFLLHAYTIWNEYNEFSQMMDSEEHASKEQASTSKREEWNELFQKEASHNR